MYYWATAVLFDGLYTSRKRWSTMTPMLPRDFSFRQVVQVRLTTVREFLHDQKRRAAEYVSAHWVAVTVLPSALLGIVLTIVFRHHLLNLLSRLSKLILAFAQGHPHFLGFLHVALDAVPDFAYMLLTLAGLSYLWPDLMKKIEKSKVMRLSFVTVFVVIGLSTIILNAVNRERQSRTSEGERTKRDNVMESVQGNLKFLVESKGQVPNETERRRRLLDTLRDEYVMSHHDVPVTMITGGLYPPDE